MRSKAVTCHKIVTMKCYGSMQPPGSSVRSCRSAGPIMPRNSGSTPAPRPCLCPGMWKGACAVRSARSRTAESSGVPVSGKDALHSVCSANPLLTP